MARVLLVHWNEPESRPREQRLKQEGHDVTCHVDPRAHPKSAVNELPEVIVIDLCRAPAQGREFGGWLRRNAATRQIPLIFVDGAADKVERVRKLLPDAVYSSWDAIGDAVRTALRRPPSEPVVPGTMDAYAGVPLWKKLGLRATMRVGLLGAPDGFSEALADAPAGVTVRDASGGEADALLLFVRSTSELRERFEGAVGALADGGRLWIVWPKKASGLGSDLSQTAVRAYGLQRGLVDYKICSVDEIWSGLCFSRRPRNDG